MSKEIWADVRGFEGLYQVSNRGGVRAVNYNHTGKPKHLKLAVNRAGYLCAYLYKADKVHCVRVHRMVAQAFIPNPEGKPQVNHIDFNRVNNSVENLEWCTASENIIHSYTNSHRKIPRGAEHHFFGVCRGANPTAKKVVQLDASGTVVKVWDCMTSVCDELGIQLSAICAVCKNKRKTAGGYKWKYYEEMVVSK